MRYLIFYLWYYVAYNCGYYAYVRLTLFCVCMLLALVRNNPRVNLVLY